MQHYTTLIANIENKIPLTQDDKERVTAVFKIKHVKRKQFILQPDFVARHRQYVISGVLRAFVIDKNGDAHTLQFAIDDWWITDLNSYINQTPGKLFIEALEDTLIAQIDYDTEQQLKKSDHKFETLFRIMGERAAAFYIKRMISALVNDAEERYRSFLKDYPQVVKRLPQYVLASYLDMSTEFLSRIRNNKTKKQTS